MKVIPETGQGQALPLQSFLLVGTVRPLRSHPAPSPKRDVGATLAVARHSHLSDENKGIREGVFMHHQLLRELIKNKGFKTQIMLPFQGENGLPFFITQGDAIGLRYDALSGRKRIGVFYALKGQYNPAQRQRLGLFENKGFKKLRSSSTWITPCKRSAARGHNNPHSPELRRSSTKSEHNVELLRSSCG